MSLADTVKGYVGDETTTTDECYIFYGQSCAFAWPEMEDEHFVDEPRYSNSYFAVNVNEDLIYVQQEEESRGEFIDRI